MMALASSSIICMSIVLQVVILHFFVKDGLIVFQKLGTSVILKNISGVMNVYSSGWWKAYL